MRSSWALTATDFPGGAAQAARLLEAIVRAAPIVVFRLDRSGQLTYVSPNVTRLLGISQEQALRSDTWTRSTDPASFEKLRAAVRSVLDGAAGSAEFEGTFDFGTGPRVLRLFCCPEADPPSSHGLLAYIEDITARRAAERAMAERQEELRAITSASPDVIAVVTPDLRVAFVSDASTSLTGIRASDRIGQRIGETVHPDDRPALLDGIRAVLAGAAEDFVVRVRTRHATGRYIVMEGHGRPALGPDGAPTAVVIIFRDISERLALEAELVKAKEAADAASAAKSEFLSRMSHELRTPLNVVLGFAQLLQMESLSSEQREWVDQIFKAGRHLLDLINEVLDIARIESGALAISPEPVSVRDVVGETVTQLRPMAAERDITIDWFVEDDDICVRADRQRLLQILLNLVVNAIKYNRRGGQVLVTAFRGGTNSDSSAAEPSLDVATIRVSDTGLGIAPEHVERLFVPFDRLGAESTDVEGTGVGLPLTLRLVQAMDGELLVDSTPGQGSVFTVLLPLAEGAPADSRSRADQRRRPASEVCGTVLYIEDNEANQALMEQIVSWRPGVRLVRAVSGSEGVQVARKDRVDLVFLDIHLPDLEGADVLRELRTDAALCHLPVYVVSADATAVQARRMRELGADGYLSKPLDVPRALEIIDAVLGSQRDVPHEVVR
ncbi:MAG: PAS domain S-box protein [Acidothermus sp.]|nr:PAS domain S-box protein [Acidothermus sp.]MCL6537425.1 PAS domain S-box protein [Acidothermus sp.]